jgi:hypothetical protein
MLFFYPGTQLMYQSFSLSNKFLGLYINQWKPLIYLGVFFVSTVWIKKQQAKAILMKVFKSGNIGAAFSYGKTNGLIYPKIRNVYLNYKKNTVLYTFSLPFGMEPKQIRKMKYCFQQVFGDNIEIEGEYREFKLIVYMKKV